MRGSSRDRGNTAHTGNRKHVYWSTRQGNIDQAGSRRQRGFCNGNEERSGVNQSQRKCAVVFRLSCTGDHHILPVSKSVRGGGCCGGHVAYAGQRGDGRCQPTAQRRVGNPRIGVVEILQRRGARHAGVHFSGSLRGRKSLAQFLRSAAFFDELTIGQVKRATRTIRREAPETGVCRGFVCPKTSRIGNHEPGDIVLHFLVQRVGQEQIVAAVEQQLVLFEIALPAWRTERVRPEYAHEYLVQVGAAGGNRHWQRRRRELAIDRLDLIENALQRGFQAGDGIGANVEPLAL